MPRSVFGRRNLSADEWAQTSGRRDEWARYIGSVTPSQSFILAVLAAASQPPVRQHHQQPDLAAVRKDHRIPSAVLGQSLIHVTHFSPTDQCVMMLV